MEFKRRCDIIVNATWWNTGELSLQRIILHTQKESIEKTLHKNYKHGSWPKDFNKSKDTPNNTDNTKAKIACPCQKVNSIRFEEPYENINYTENTHADTHLVDTQEKYIEDAEVEQEELF